MKTTPLYLNYIVSSLLLASTSTLGVEIDTQTLFQRLAGKPLLKADVRYTQMENLLKEGKKLEAAAIATSDVGFYDNTVRHIAAVMSGRSETPLEPFNDFIATFIGTVRDDIDARELLTGDFRYKAKANLELSPVSISDNKHYEEFESKALNLIEDLEKVTPQWPKFSGAAGLLTTRAWAFAHYFAGTNRRSTEYSFREFLCAPIESWKTPNLSDYHVRRDVDRAPGMDPNRYRTECRTCHAALDGLSGAFASFDFKADKIIFQTGWVAPKYNQNIDVFPSGYQTKDSSWMNLLSSAAHQETFGWRTALEGVGIRAFGKMVSESKAFSRCMVKRVFSKVCRRDPMATESKFIEDLALSFEQEGYRLKPLFQHMALSPQCLETGE